MKRICKYLFVSILAIAFSEVKGQTKQMELSKITANSKTKTAVLNPIILSQKKFVEITNPIYKNGCFSKISSYSIKSQKGTIVPNNYYYAQELGFFCRKEIQFEKATGVPLRFRIGPPKSP